MLINRANTPCLIISSLRRVYNRCNTAGLTKASNFYTSTTLRLSIPSILSDSKLRKKLSYLDISRHINRSEDWTAGLFHGKHLPTELEVEKLCNLLEISKQDYHNSKDDSVRDTVTDQKGKAGSDGLGEEGLKDERILPDVISTIVKEIPTSSQRTIMAQGWIKSIRKQKSVWFVELVDGSGSEHLQLVIRSDQLAQEHLTNYRLQVGCSIRALGHLVSSKGQSQSKELSVMSIELVGNCPADHYPLQRKEHSLSYLRKFPHLRVRTPEGLTLMRLRSMINSSIGSFFEAHHFVRVETPIITFNDCEGAGEVFGVEPDSEDVANNSTTPAENSTTSPSFFGSQAYLTVSAQLHLEALSAGLGRVYTFGPAFRAERSRTNRHLAEFWMLEAEVSFCDELEPLMRLVESFIKSILRSICSSKDSHKDFDVSISNNPKTVNPTHQLGIHSEERWPRVSYTEAVRIIQTRSSPENISSITWGDGLSSDQEKWLTGCHFESPVFVTDYPQALKPFYMRRSALDEREDKTINDGNRNRPTVASFDLLVPGIGELAGGSLREPDLKTLRRNMTTKGMIRSELGLEPTVEPQVSHHGNSYEWYLDLRRYGSVPTGGFGIGWERLVCWVLGIDNVRESIAFPRVIKSDNC
ncbi:hypothetical protein BY996DRAFT_7053268 [Phakopsora pachyrhizi]|nr:hypothetical protein BY996DRAFT_7053268 [Phakopsora pachyrhizi]